VFFIFQPTEIVPLFSLVLVTPLQITANITPDKLLRLRKNLPTTLPVATSQDAWERVIAPLFPHDQIVQQSLVRLGSRVIDDLNDKLRHWEQHPADNQHPRPSRRQGTYLADDEFGLLITDMSAGT
jgi:inositol-pentakisphosphate 2-kinase